MVDISSQNNKINVTVSSSGNTANTNVTPDYAQYYSEKSKEWAISNRIVDNTDYSSKYYANESKKQADISTAKATEVIESANTAVSNIESARDNAITNVNTAGAIQVALATEQATIATNKASEVVASGNEALSNIDTAKNNAITSITNQETTSKNVLIDECATQVGLIQNEGATQVANVQSTGFYMRDDKLYFINSQGEETEFKSGSGLEVCDIGISLYVDETKGLRRYLNGQIVDINTNTQAFLNRLQEITTLHPSLLCTEEEWQTAKTMSAFGQVGKFVFNYSGDDIVSVRLPRVVNVQGLFDLQNLGMTVGESLPNLKTSNSIGHTLNASSNDISPFIRGGRSTVGASGTSYNYYPISFDASLSSSTYQDNAPVQQEAIQYPYFIQIATGSETENNIINEIELNNPYSLFDSKYSDHELNNLSWLKSEGQWNAKAVYPTAYDELLREYNSPDRLATFNRDAFEVVGSPTITDDGVASGFSSNSYVRVSIDLSNKPFIFETPKFVYSQVTSDRQYLFTYGRYNTNLYMQLFMNNSGVLYTSIRNGSSDIFYKQAQLSLNNTYQVKYVLNTTEASIYLKTNDNDYELWYTKTNTSLYTTNSTTMCIGQEYNGSTRFYLGSIDLKQFSITVDGVKIISGAKSKVKLSTEEYTDYDFVLNTADETFRLPLKTNLASGKAVVGNGLSLGLTNGNLNLALGSGYNGNGFVIAGQPGYGNPVGTITHQDGATNSKSMGVTTDPTKSGIELSDSGLYLYFYVGETVQNANLIDAGRIGEQLATKTDMLQASGAGMPSDKYIDLTLGASGSTYTAPANGWFVFGRNTTNPAGCGLFNQTTGIGCSYVIERSWNMLSYVPAKKGDVVSINYWQGNSTTIFRFIYAEGEQ